MFRRMLKVFRLVNTINGQTDTTGKTSCFETPGMTKTDKVGSWNCESQ